jgi:hypothetical protein
MICSHAHFMRQFESFGVNSGYYLSGDGSWAGQMQPAAEIANGSTGLVPAPLAGQQNSYLRGDGTWQQANNAPTAAHYLFTTTTEDQDTGSADTYLIKYPMSGSGVISSNSTVITQPNATAFVLQPGYVYKCTAGVTLATDTGTYLNAIQFCSTTGVAYGVPGSILGTTSADVNNICTNSTAIAYIAPTTRLALNVRFTNRSKNNILTGIVSAFLVRLGAPQIPGGTWVSIEVISNNNTITAFAGATSTTNGFIGYIPAPLAGQQNHVLTGDSKWTGPQYLMVTNPAGQTVSGGKGFKWDPSTAVSSDGAITLLADNAQFKLDAGYNFKLTAALSYTDGKECTFRWYNVTTAKLLGAAGNVNCVNNPQNGTAFAYIKQTSAPVIVQLNIIYAASGSAWVAGFNNDTHCMSWAAIEILR